MFQSALIVACYYGYVNVVIALAQCPHLDVNWQDNEGNTALITAAQAGKHNASQQRSELEVRLSFISRETYSIHFLRMCQSAQDDGITRLPKSYN